MSENTGYVAFAMYNAIKLHFGSSYDYFKYHGKTKITPEQFMVRKDKYSFYKLSRRFSVDELRNFYVANFVYQDIQWVGDMTGPEGEDIYKQWKKRKDSMAYMFRDDLDTLFINTKSPDDILKNDANDYPKLLKMAMSNDISIETLCILNDIMNFFSLWQKQIDDDIVWPSWKKKCEKYLPFIEYDKNRYKSILKEKVNEYK